MKPLESLAGMGSWAGKNTAHNLGFIPEDRLNWKPAPTANSALEIVGHAVGVFRAMLPVLRGGDWKAPDFPTVTTLSEAQDLLVTTSEEYAEALREVDPRDLGRTITVWQGLQLPLALAASMPVVDMIHHHGQIAYIQTLLGDTEPHFIDMGQRAS